MDIDFFRAWELWLQGVELTNYRLFGLSIFWLGRIGKIVQFLGALVVIVEIIGFSRFSKFSTDLKELINFQNIHEIAFFGITNTRKWFQKATSKKLTKEEREAIEIDSSYMWTLIVLALFSAIYSSVRLNESMHWFWAIFCGNIVFSFSGLLIPIVIAFFILLFYGVLYAINLILIGPLIWVLDQKRLNTIVNVIALVLVVAGTIFDILAS